MDITGERIDPELLMLRNNKESGFNYQQRRHEPWRENYTLYRDTVQINRITQRQSVNLPIMKAHVRSMLKDVDDMPVLYFENLDNNKQAEIFKNEYWSVTNEENKMELQDIVDKKQVFLFGRSFDQWQIIDGKVVMTVQDPQDILLSRFTNPFDIHSSRFLIHNHIFVPLSVLEQNPDYDKDALDELKLWFMSNNGIVKSATNEQMLIEKNQKMADMGVPDIEDPVLGETYVELSLHFVFRKGTDDEDEQIYLYVEAEDMKILMKKPLEEVIGVTKDHFFRTHFPYCSWADDLERQDVWSDGVGDIVRTPNKVLNSWFSQLVENRTLRNFGMHYYNSSLEGFQPQTFNPVPWGWYPIPVGQGGNISDVMQKVDIPDLSESLDEMQYVMTVTEKATGATSTQQGAQTERQTTLGEVQLVLGEAKERVKGMSKFYTQVWKERGLMFIKMIEAGHDKLDAVKIYKKGKNTEDIYSREIAPNDWMSESGYRCKVWSQDEKRVQDTKQLEKLNVAVMNMPDNPKLREIYQRKLLEFVDLKPEEILDVMEYETQKQTMMMQSGMMGQGMFPLQQPQQMQQQLPVRQ